MSPGAAGDVTGLLKQWGRGDRGALAELLPIVYSELRRIAGRQLRRERPNHTLEPTALVHELYFDLIGQRDVDWQSRAHFFALSARLMRRILVDHARARGARKRGGLLEIVDLEDAAGAAPGLDVIAVDEALTRLAARDAEHARIVELRYFAGLTVEETAHVLGRSARTVKREFRLAKAWLYRELTA